MATHLDNITEENEEYDINLFPLEGNLVLNPMVRGDGFYKTLGQVVKKLGKGLGKVVSEGGELFVKGAKSAYKGITIFPYGMYGHLKWENKKEEDTYKEGLTPEQANEISNAINFGPYTPTLPGYNNPKTNEYKR